MENNKASPSINISGDQLSNVQIGGQAGRDLTVTQSQQIGEGIADKPITPDEVADLLDQLKILLQGANLPENDKDRAIRSIETAKDEVQADEPDKEFAAKNLQRATRVLKEAGKTVEAGTGLWSKVQPILEALSSWLGVVTSFLA